MPCCEPLTDNDQRVDKVGAFRNRFVESEFKKTGSCVLWLTSEQGARAKRGKVRRDDEVASCVQVFHMQVLQMMEHIVPEATWTGPSPTPVLSPFQIVTE